MIMVTFTILQVLTMNRLVLQKKNKKLFNQERFRQFQRKKKQKGKVCLKKKWKKCICSKRRHKQFGMASDVRNKKKTNFGPNKQTKFCCGKTALSSKKCFVSAAATQNIGITVKNNKKYRFLSIKKKDWILKIFHLEF